MDLRPGRGGFLRPFGCGWFIREFLSGKGPEGAPVIDPGVGAPQADIHRAYKEALHRKYAEDWAYDDALAEIKAREKKLKRRLSGDEEAEIFARTEERYLARIPYKLTCCRFHSFVVYFSNLQRLGWVEFTGGEEPSMFQQHYPAGPPRKYFRLTEAGREAPDEAWSNPLFWLYRDRWSREYLRELRGKHKYIKAKRR
ncbi:hypothetical protein ACFLXE_07300 [Chloroflexota bacterium]